MSKPYGQQVNVELDHRVCPILIRSGLMNSLDNEIENGPGLENCEHLVIITDRTVDRHYGDLVAGRFRERGWKIDKLIVDDGERSKSIGTCDTLWQQMVERGANRGSVVCALGGGVVGDLAGFIAATYMRGIRLVQVPTSLLAQVDSSVGGKVGVNLPQGKNLVGSFLQPQLVLIDPSVLSTLDQRNFNAGMAEVIKYAVILDAKFFEWLEQNDKEIRDRDPGTLVTMIGRCCQFKADIVREDEFETTGRRAILNYGHTLGHAVEAISGYGEYLHGEAVSIGMHFAAELAHSMGRIDKQMVLRQKRLLESFDLPTAVGSIDSERLIESMYRDKKMTGRSLNLVLSDRLGHVELVPRISDEQIRSILGTMMQ